MLFIYKGDTIETDNSSVILTGDKISIVNNYPETSSILNVTSGKIIPISTYNKIVDYLEPLIHEEDKVNHPSHYTWLKEKCGIEVIDITRHMDFDLGNAIKYILRCNRKSENGYSDKDKAIEDLEKAIFYIKDEINLLKTK